MKPHVAWMRTRGPECHARTSADASLPHGFAPTEPSIGAPADAVECRWLDEPVFKEVRVFVLALRRTILYPVPVASLLFPKGSVG
jgi:hypothetical protein